MLNTICSESLTINELLICTAASLIFGVICVALFMYKNTRYSKGFVTTLVLMPIIVQVVIMLVNGSIGAGIAVMGAFNLVRFRSIPGNAREISSIFLAMAMGIATGMGYIGLGAIIVGVIAITNVILANVNIGIDRSSYKNLKVTIPENLDYTEIFDDIFAQNLEAWELIKTKTTNMGSLYELTYEIRFKREGNEKMMIDSMRCRNGNLGISISRALSDNNQM